MIDYISKGNITPSLKMLLQQALDQCSPFSVYAVDRDLSSRPYVGQLLHVAAFQMNIEPMGFLSHENKPRGERKTVELLDEAISHLQIPTLCFQIDTALN